MQDKIQHNFSLDFSNTHVLLFFHCQDGGSLSILIGQTPNIDLDCR